MAWLLLGVALAGTADVTLIDVETPSLSAAMWPGEVSSPPFQHWQAALPGGKVNSASHAERSRPVVVGPNILIGSAAGDALYMLSRRNGGVVRTFEADAPVASQAILDGGRVYFADTGGTVWCYELEGELVWKHPGAAPILSPPLVAEGLVIITDVNDLTVALKADTADLAWRYQRKKDVSRVSELALYAAPGAVRSGDDVLLGYSDGAVVAVALTTGDARWDLQVGAGRYPDLVAEPVALNGQVFVSGYMEPFVAIDPATSQIRWRVDVGAASQPIVAELPAEGGGTETLLLHPGTDGTLRAIRPATGDIAHSWTAATPSALTSPVITPAGILMASAGGSLEIVDPTTWATIWSWHGDRLLVGMSTAPVIDGRQVLVVSNSGTLYSLLAPSVKTPEERKFKLFDPPLEGR